MNPIFSGKKVMVTGAANGLGKGIVKAFLDSGAQVAAVDISPRLSDTVAELAVSGVIHPIQGDLSQPKSRREAFESSLQALGGIDVLVNAAGIQIRHPSAEFDLDDWCKVLEINLTAVFELCQLAGRQMLRSGGGKIVNIASMLSFFGGMTVPAYSASKGGVAQLTKALSNEWSAHNINVNAVAPGYMATDMNTALIQDETRNAEILSRIPKTRWGTPEDIAGPVLFLSSAAADYICGAVLPVDGGYLVR